MTVETKFECQDLATRARRTLLLKKRKPPLSQCFEVWNKQSVALQTSEATFGRERYESHQAWHDQHYGRSLPREPGAEIEIAHAGFFRILSKIFP